ncbi:MAG TPA: hypothetical protein VEF71_13265 [Streptosporangiaceae bacterium]|nr:hypothetical protein [Streptosporangiaceae bacterium]
MAEEPVPGQPGDGIEGAVSSNRWVTPGTTARSFSQENDGLAAQVTAGRQISSAVHER